MDKPVPRKVLLGTANRRQMYLAFNRHHQAPFDDERLTGRLYAGEWFRIDRFAYHEMQDVLPPRYLSGGAFALQEMLAESVTSVFFELTIRGETRFYHAYCDLSDRNAVDEMRGAIIARETSGPPLTRQEVLDHLWSTTPDEYRGLYDGVRTILVLDAVLGTVPKRLEDLTTAEVAERVMPQLPSLAA